MVKEGGQVRDGDKGVVKMFGVPNVPNTMFRKPSRVLNVMVRVIRVRVRVIGSGSLLGSKQITRGVGRCRCVCRNCTGDVDHRCSEDVDYRYYGVVLKTEFKIALHMVV